MDASGSSTKQCSDNIPVGNSDCVSRITSAARRAQHRGAALDPSGGAREKGKASIKSPSLRPCAVASLLMPVADQGMRESDFIPEREHATQARAG